MIDGCTRCGCEAVVVIRFPVAAADRSKNLRTGFRQIGADALEVATALTFGQLAILPLRATFAGDAPTNRPLGQIAAAVIVAFAFGGHAHTGCCGKAGVVICVVVATADRLELFRAILRDRSASPCLVSCSTLSVDSIVAVLALFARQPLQTAAYFTFAFARSKANEADAGCGCGAFVAVSIPIATADRRKLQRACIGDSRADAGLVGCSALRLDVVIAKLIDTAGRAREPAAGFAFATT